MARNRNENLKTPAPVLAVIGVGDLAVEKIREVSSDVQARSAKIHLEPKRLQADLEAAAKHRVDDVRTVQSKAQERAEAVFNDVVTQATTTYDSLTGRGKQLVDRIRRQQSVQDVVRSVGVTKSQAKATTTTARKSASSTGTTARKSASSTGATAKRGASATTTSAKKSASQTKSRAKATGTSARKAADAAGTAAQESAEKVGD